MPGLFELLDHNDVFLRTVDAPEAEAWLREHPGHRCRVPAAHQALLATVLRHGDQLAEAVLSTPCALSGDLVVLARSYRQMRAEQPA